MRRSRSITISHSAMAIKRLETEIPNTSFHFFPVIFLKFFFFFIFIILPSGIFFSYSGLPVIQFLRPTSRANNIEPTYSSSEP